jgi:hypothetical protein
MELIRTLVVVLLVGISSHANAQYCLKVNIWELLELPKETQEAVLKTVDGGSGFSATHGKPLRKGADGDAAYNCENTEAQPEPSSGKWSRYLSSVKVNITYSEAGAPKTRSEMSKDGVAFFGFKEQTPVEVSIELADRSMILSPKDKGKSWGVIRLGNASWEADKLWNVHFLLKRK